MKTLMRVVILVCMLQYVNIFAQTEDESDDSVFVSDTVMVWAEKEAYSPLSKFGSVDIFSHQDFEKQHPKDIADIISFASGVSADRTAYVGHNINPWIRGTNRVLLLIDGIPLRSPTLGVNNLSLYSYFPVKDVEVIKGPSSSFFGSTPLGGALNLHLKAHQTGKPYTRLIIDGGDCGFDQLGVEFTQGFGRYLSYYISLSKMQQAGHRKRSKYKSEEFSVKLNSYFVDFMSAEGVIKMNQSSGYLPGMEYPEWVPESLTSHYSGTQGDDNVFANLKLFSRIGDNIRIMNYVNYQTLNENYSSILSGYDTNYIDTNIIVDSVSVDTILEVIDTTLWSSTHDTHEWYISMGGAKIFIESFMNNHITLDLHFEHSVVKSTKTGRHTLDEYSFGIEDRLDLPLNAGIIARLRVDSDHRNKLHYSPFVGINYEQDQFSFFSNYSMGFKNPSINDLYYELDEWFCQGNPDLESETSQSFDLGTRIKYDDLDIEVSLFYNIIEDMIEWQLDPTDYTFKPQNISKAKLSGIESKVAYNPDKYLNSQLSHTFLNAVDEDDNRLQYRPQHKINAFLQSTMGFWQDNLQLTCRLEEEGYVGITKPEYNPIFQLNEEEEYDPIFISNLKFFVKFHDVDFYFFIENLTDEEYELRQWFPLPGRYLRFGGSWKFFY